MVILPFTGIWLILNVRRLFSGYILWITFMNWLFGAVVLFVSRALMIKTFKEQKKVFFVF